MYLKILSTICLLLLFGCTATPYQPRAMTGGFKETNLEGTVWRVAFSGNAYTTYETVQTYWLYRCAELTLEQGYEGFEVLSHLELTSTNPLRPFGSGYRVIQAQVYYPVFEKPVIEADIRLLKRPFSPAPPRIFDAVELKSKLEPVVTDVEKCSADNVCPHVHKYLHPEGTFDEEAI